MPVQTAAVCLLLSQYRITTTPGAAIHWSSSCNGWRVRPEPRTGAPDSLLSDHFHARPVNRGDNTYRGLGEVTVNELIDYMLRNYPIDRGRVNITGESMGGGGTWNMATNYPYRFASAAPIYGYAEGTLLQNLQQVPVWNSHGLRDFRVNIGASHYAVEILKTLGKNHQAHGVSRKRT